MGHWYLMQVRHVSRGTRAGIKVVPGIETPGGEKKDYKVVPVTRSLLQGIGPALRRSSYPSCCVVPPR